MPQRWPPWAEPQLAGQPEAQASRLKLGLAPEAWRPVRLSGSLRRETLRYRQRTRPESGRLVWRRQRVRRARPGLQRAWRTVARLAVAPCRAGIRRPTRFRDRKRNRSERWVAARVRAPELAEALAQASVRALPLECEPAAQAWPARALQQPRESLRPREARARRRSGSTIASTTAGSTVGWTSAGSTETGASST